MKFVKICLALTAFIFSAVAMAQNANTENVSAENANTENPIAVSQKNTPINILSNDPAYLQQMEALQNNPVTKKEVPIPSESLTPRVVKVAAPNIPVEVKNKTQLFVFKDLNNVDPAASQADTLDLDTRQSQVEALRQTAARK